MARVSRRPSSSGRTTFMARSAGDRPRGELCQASRVLPDRTTCSTGTSAASSTVVSSSRMAEQAKRADRRGRRPGKIATEQGRGVTQGLAQVVDAAFAEKLLETGERRG